MIDLHLHTTNSDGTFTPKELVHYAARKGVKIISITDHDNVDALAQAAPIATECGMELISGVEITTYRAVQAIHILGYYINSSTITNSLMELLNGNKGNRSFRKSFILERLQQQGIFDEQTRQRLMAIEKGFRSAIVDELVGTQYARNREEAWSKYVNPVVAALGGCAPEVAIKNILDSGGIPVLAHPNLIQSIDLESLIRELVGSGLKGLECFTPTDSSGQQIQSLNLADKYGLIPTGGSDFHGKNPDVGEGHEIGCVTVPYESVVKLRQAARLGGVTA